MPSNNPLLRLLAVNCALGMLLGALLVGGLFWFDTAGIRTLVAADQGGSVAVLILLFAFMSMGGSMMMGSAIMAQKADGGRPRGSGRKDSTSALDHRLAEARIPLPPQPRGRIAP